MPRKRKKEKKTTINCISHDYQPYIDRIFRKCSKRIRFYFCLDMSEVMEAAQVGKAT